MIINRYNYETYFLLYIDKELSAEEMQAVEAFAAAHPDLAAELELLQQSVMKPEKHLVFTDKESLMKPTANVDFIDDNNYEEYFILYADDELSVQQKATVEQYVDAHPERRHEFELFQQVKLQPEKITCDFKADLYREKKERKIPPFRWSIAAAAAVLLLAGWFWLNKAAAPSEDRTARMETPRKTESTKAGAVENNWNATQELAATEKDNAQQPDIDNAGVQREQKENLAVARSNNRSSVAATKSITVQSATGKKRQPDTSASIAVKEPEMKSLQATPDMIRTKDVAVTTHQPVNDVAIDIAAPDEEDNDDRDLVSFATNDKPENVFLTNIPVDNNVPLRSFLRKASRVINKVTALKHSNRGGIIIGNVEIAIQ